MACLASDEYSFSL